MKKVNCIILLVLSLMVSGCSYNESEDKSGVLSEEVTTRDDNLEFTFTDFWFGEIRYEDLGSYKIFLTMDVIVENNSEETLATSQPLGTVEAQKEGSDQTWGLPYDNVASCDPSVVDQGSSTTCSLELEFAYNEGFSDYGVYEIIFERNSFSADSFEDSFFIEIEEDKLELIEEME